MPFGILLPVFVVNDMMIDDKSSYGKTSTLQSLSGFFPESKVTPNLKKKHQLDFYPAPSNSPYEAPLRVCAVTCRNTDAAWNRFVNGRPLRGCWPMNSWRVSRMTNDLCVVFFQLAIRPCCHHTWLMLCLQSSSPRLACSVPAYFLTLGRHWWVFFVIFLVLVQTSAEHCDLLSGRRIATGNGRASDSFYDICTLNGIK